MDDLDRLFRRLVEEIGPGSGGRRPPLTVAGLQRVLASPSVTPAADPEQRSRLLLRLLAGERGYLSADRDVQERAAAALHAPDGHAASLAAFAERHVALGTEAVRRVLSASAAIVAAPAAPTAAPAPARPVAIPRRASARAAVPAGAAGATTTAPAAPRERGRGQKHESDCHYCGQLLPRLRALTFCPHCGQNLTVRHCPACSAELDVKWKFCVACGRDVGSAGDG